MIEYTPREFAKRWARAAARDVHPLAQRHLLIACAHDIAFALREAGEDTHWLNRYLRGVSARLNVAQWSWSEVRAAMREIKWDDQGEPE